MNSIKNHIIFQILTFCLATILILPTALRFIHIFEHDSHIFCDGNQSTHIHQIDMECEFQDYHLHTNFIPTYSKITFLKEQNHLPKIISQYFFISDYQRLPFSLRGPPTVYVI